MLMLTGSLKINRTQYPGSNKILFKCFVQSKTFNFSFKYSSFWSFFNIVLNFVNIKANQKQVYNNPPDLPVWLLSTACFSLNSLLTQTQMRTQIRTQMFPDSNFMLQQDETHINFLKESCSLSHWFTMVFIYAIYSFLNFFLTLHSSQWFLGEAFSDFPR